MLKIAEDFVSKIDLKYRKKWNPTNSKLEKAKIGIVGNILLPSSSNTTSISNKEVNWISIHTKDKVKEINHLYNFLKSKIG